MRATIEAIREAAFERWEHRGRVHGFDRADWLAAERHERLSRNYRIVAADRLDAGSSRSVGSRRDRRCRFCDRGEPRAVFADRAPIFPAEFGPGSPEAHDQCESCVAEFSTGIDRALSRFVDLASADPACLAEVPVDAFKGLAKLALAVMPAADLDEHGETIDWVGNADHDFDLQVFRGLSCALNLAPSPFPASWSALARREGDEIAWPSMLFFLGIGRLSFQIAVPLGQRDDELDVPLSTLPDVLPPCPFGLGFDPVARWVLPIAACGTDELGIGRARPRAASGA